MELVQCADGTVPPHDDSGWWFEPFQGAKGRWLCGSNKDHTDTACLKFSRSTSHLFCRSIGSSLRRSILGPVRRECSKGPSLLAPAPKANAADLVSKLHVAEYVAASGAFQIARAVEHSLWSFVHLVRPSTSPTRKTSRG